jgi:exonuclease VII small subunit
MIYFKDEPAPVPPSKLDYVQLAKVADFRASLGDEGALYWSFSSAEVFEKLVRLHLTRQIQAWRNLQTAPKELKISVPAVSCDTKPSRNVVENGSDDAGVLDLMIQFEDEFASLLEIVNRISSATEEIGEKMGERSKDTNAFLDGPDANNRKAATRLINKAANDMEQYVFRMDAEIPLFSKHLNTGMNAMVKAAEIVVDINLQGEDLEQLLENVQAMRSFRHTISTTIDSLSSFQKSVASLPRLTTTLNRAKKGVTNVLQRMIDEFENARRMAVEAETTFETMTAS